MLKPSKTASFQANCFIAVIGHLNTSSASNSFTKNIIKVT